MVRTEARCLTFKSSRIEIYHAEVPLRVKGDVQPLIAESVARKIEPVQQLVRVSMAIDPKQTQLSIINRRYSNDRFNVVHSIPRHTLIGNLAKVIDPSELHGKTVLEIGAGCSSYLPLFLELGVRKLIANDLLEKRLKLNNIRDPRYVEIAGDFLETDFPENEVDVIFSHLTFMFLVPLFEEMFRKVCRIVKPGGILVTIDANYVCPISFYRYLADQSGANPARPFNPFQFAKIAQANGLTVERLVPFTSNKTWTTGHWLLGTCFGMRAIKSQYGLAAGGC